jgi:pimeloyl-ACP methyl ester carboxylesterase
VVYFVLGLALAYCLGVFWLARIYIHPGTSVAPTPKGLTDVSLPLSPYSVPLWVSKGLTGKPPKSKTVFILVHGYGGDRSSWKDTAHDLMAKGYEVVLPEMPGHGANPDPTCGFGIKESKIVLATIRWSREQMKDDPKIILVGLSMGGAACWLASQQDPTVSAVITEGSLTHLEQTTDRWFEKILPGGSLLFTPVKKLATRMAHVDLDAVDVVGAAKAWHGRPSLVIQGDEDRLISMEDAKELSKALGCELWIVPGARHAHCYRLARKTYLNKLVQIAESIN